MGPNVLTSFGANPLIGSELALADTGITDREIARPNHRIPLTIRTAILELVIENSVVCMACIAIFQVLLPAQVESANPAAKVVNLGWVMAIGAFVSMVSGPIFGSLSDNTRSKHGRRAPWIFWGALACALSFAALGFSTSLPLIVVCSCVMQLALSAFGTILAAVMPERVPVDHRGTASAWLGIVGPVGTFVGTGIAVQLMAAPRIAYATVAAVFFASGIWFSKLNRYTSEGPCVPTKPIMSLKELTCVFFSSLSSKDFRYLFVSRFFLLIAYCSVAGYQLYFIQDYIVLSPDRDANQVLATFNMIVTCSCAVAVLVAGAASDRFRRRRVFVVVSAVCLGLSMFLPLAMPSYTGLVLYGLASGASIGCYFAVDTVLVTQVLPDGESTARDLGILNIAGAGPQILAPAVGAVVIKHLGGYQGLLVVAAVLSVVSALFILGVKSGR
jgi:MFS family permease